MRGSDVVRASHPCKDFWFVIFLKDICNVSRACQGQPYIWIFLFAFEARRVERKGTYPAQHVDLALKKLDSDCLDEIDSLVLQVKQSVVLQGYIWASCHQMFETVQLQ